MTKFPEARQVLFEYLESYFEHKGYRCGDGDLHFKRSTPFGHYAIKLTVEPLLSGVKFKLFLGLRYDEVERWLASFQLPGNHFSELSYTLMVDSKVFDQAGTFHQWTCQSTTEVFALGEAIIHYLDHVGFDFLKKHQSLQQLHELFNEDVKRAAKWTNQNYLIAFRAMTVAKLINASDYDRLYQVHHQFLSARGFTGAILETFDRTFARLKHVSVN